MVRGRRLVLRVVVLGLVVPTIARATPTSRLVYSRTAEAATCPDEQALRRAVAARVGYDPFFAYANRTIVSALSRRDGAFVGTVDLIDEVHRGDRPVSAVCVAPAPPTGTEPLRAAWGTLSALGLT